MIKPAAVVSREMSSVKVGLFQDPSSLFGTIGRKLCAMVFLLAASMTSSFAAKQGAQYDGPAQLPIATVSSAMQRADCVLVDGTCWRDDELIALGISKKRARDMGHRPLDGSEGMLALLGDLPQATRRILIHINNTNPILDEDSAEHRRVRDAGVEIAHDGMEITI